MNLKKIAYKTNNSTENTLTGNNRRFSTAKDFVVILEKLQNTKS